MTMNARHGCDSDEDEVEALARNLEQACCDPIGREHDEVHEVSDDDAMDQNMDARRDFDHDFEDATIGEGIDDLDNIVCGDDDDDDDDVAMINVDCGNDDDNFGDNDDLF
ncbi:coiled-coil domain-containing protein 1-like [Camellia sinensis]|uniref:coiled-coil domain-containing protein 1-like n=1 Tax=Camellia sinensis TaxID=4442 RepID=UPI0010358CA7|nr:coiled-coil domain-containing protein 1-like [Camellia sinensis]